MQEKGESKGLILEKYDANPNLPQHGPESLAI